MSEVDDVEQELAAAKLAILKNIPAMARKESQLSTLYLALAYAALEYGNVPSEIPRPPQAR